MCVIRGERGGRKTGERGAGAIGGVAGRHASLQVLHGVSDLADGIMKAKKKRGVEAVSELGVDGCRWGRGWGSRVGVGVVCLGR